MPESNAAAKRRQFKANRAAGLGDAMGRMVRQKDPPKLSSCTICQQEMKITKTNTELSAHAEGKHGSTVEECFPGATAIAEELAEAAAQKQKGSGGGGSDGPTKAEKKAKQKHDLDDLLNAGLKSSSKKK